MFKQPSMPSLQSDIFLLRDKIVADSNMRKKIHEINSRSIPMQKVDSIQDHKRSQIKLRNASFANIRLKNSSVDNANMRLLNKIKEISCRNKTPQSKNYSSSFSFGANIIRQKSIENENKNFMKRLIRIDSPLSKNIMEVDFKKHIKNEKLMRKINGYVRGVSPKRMTYIKNHLPNLFINKTP